MKKLKLLLIPLVFLFATGILGYSLFRFAASPVCSENCEEVVFVIKKGESFSSAAERLEQANLIHSRFVFQALAMQQDLVKKMQAGDFKLSPKMSSLAMAEFLTHGMLDRWVTIIEGWRREEIAEKLSASDLSNFDPLVFIKATEKLEGKLFPDTYLIPKEADSQKVIDILLKNFNKKTPQPSTETLIMASIVEREARGQEAMRMVAGVLLKRLEKDWPLQADATVQYAVASAANGWWPKNLTKADINFKSPYNTYTKLGLPPQPICNPGLLAIEAVLQPAPSDYWFYLTDSQGVMHYAETQEEHTANVQKYLLK